MCRNKIKTGLLALALSISLAGCGTSGSLVTDSGSGKKEGISPKDYLMTDALGQQTTETIYQVVTLSKGTFEEVAKEQMLKREYLNAPTVQLDVDGRESTLGWYDAQSMLYVEEGDTIATVYVEVDELEIEKSRLNLQRLQERLQSDEAKAKEDLQKILDEKAKTYDRYQKSILDIRYAQRQADWEYQKYNYENQIQEATEELKRLTTVGEVYEVKTDRAGYVYYDTWYYTGKEMWDGIYICHILDNEQVFSIAKMQKEQFYYGMEVDFDTNHGMAKGRVINGGSWALYGNLEPSGAIFLLEFEEDILDKKSGFNRIMLQGNVKTVENVIVIPAKAVTEKNGEYFVTVLKEDGSLLKTEFVPGGSNKEEYWVLEGLSEGMQIVYY